MTYTLSRVYKKYDKHKHDFFILFYFLVEGELGRGGKWGKVFTLFFN